VHRHARRTAQADWQLDRARVIAAKVWNDPCGGQVKMLYGHLAGYRDPDNPSDPTHSHDPNDIMSPFVHAYARCDDYGTVFLGFAPPGIARVGISLPEDVDQPGAESGQGRAALRDDEESPEAARPRRRLPPGQGQTEAVGTTSAPPCGGALVKPSAAVEPRGRPR
jgi:hypothetical protein